MDSSTYKSVKTRRSYTYFYYASPEKSDKTILLLHGFPEYADMWADQVTELESLGYKCIVPELLGYGKTSKPLDAEAYNSEGLSQDLADILDAEDVAATIVIGHDWGSFLAGRFANWQPKRVVGLVSTSVAYRPAGKLDLPASNAAMKKGFGYEAFGYWEWIASAEAPKVMDSHLESLFSLLFAKDDGLWKTDFTPTGMLPKWLESDRMVPTADFVDDSVKSKMLERWSEGFAPKLGWYKAMTENIHWDHEQKLPAEAFQLTIPVLFIGGARDAPAPAVLGQLVMKPLCSDFTGTVVDSAHWMLREKPKEWMAIVKDWLSVKF